MIENSPTVDTETQIKQAFCDKLFADIDLAIMRLADQTSPAIEANFIKKPKSAE